MKRISVFLTLVLILLVVNSSSLARFSFVKSDFPGHTKKYFETFPSGRTYLDCLFWFKTTSPDMLNCMAGIRINPTKEFFFVREVIASKEFSGCKSCHRISRHILNRHKYFPNKLKKKENPWGYSDNLTRKLFKHLKYNGKDGSKEAVDIKIGIVKKLLDQPRRDKICRKWSARGTQVEREVCVHLDYKNNSFKVVDPLDTEVNFKSAQPTSSKNKKNMEIKGNKK